MKSSLGKGIGTVGIWAAAAYAAPKIGEAGIAIFFFAAFVTVVMWGLGE